MNDWLMDLVDVFLVNNWLDHFMDDWLMMFVNNLFMSFKNNVFMMFMDNILMLFFDYGSLDMGLDNRSSHMFFDFSL